MSHGRKIAVIGLGYFGLPVAAAFARACSLVIGFDIDAGRVGELKAGQGRTRDVKASDLQHATPELTCDKANVRVANFFIVTLPTPIDAANRPDLSAMFEGGRCLIQRLLHDGSGLVLDMKMKLDRGAKPRAIELWRL